MGNVKIDSQKLRFIKNAEYYKGWLAGKKYQGLTGVAKEVAELKVKHERRYPEIH